MWAENKVLTFGLTSNPGGWPTTNSTTLTNYTYTLNAVNYTFALKNVKCNSGYLMMTSTAVLGLPAIDGYKLTKVVASNSGGCSTSTKVGISSSSSSETYITGGATKTWSTQGSTYTYTLTSTAANTMYYLYVTNKNAQVTQLQLTYEPTTVAITSIVFDKNEASVGVGGTVTITPTISPTGYTETPVWASNDTDVATVSNGVVTGVAEGTAMITLTSPSNASIFDVCEVTVNAATPVSGVSLDVTSKDDMYVGDELQLTATVAPANATNKNVTWSSSDETVATVSSTGLVTALKAGTATITVTTVDGSKTATCDLTISNVDVTGVSLDQSSATIYVGFAVGNTVQLTATVAPSNATDKSVSWESSNTSVATVSSAGLVTAVAVGTATITVTTTDGSKTATCAITVENAPGTEARPYTIAQAKYAIDNSGATSNVYVHGIVCTGGSGLSSGKLIYWISDDGTTTNKFEVYKGYDLDGEDFTNNSDIQVGDIVTVYGNITLYSTTYEFAEGSQLTSFKRKDNSDLAITSSTDVALEKTTANTRPTSTITWNTSSTGAMSFVSSDESVATVSSAGVITAEGEGEATITISQAADDDYKASGNKSVTVTVTDNRTACATSIDLTSAKTILKGASAAIAATSTKADGFTGSITYSYSSANSSIFSITDGNYSGAGVGATTVTVTATPTGGNADNYKAASQEVAVTVNGTNSISIDPTSKTQAYSAGAFNIAATVPTENYNGTVTASSDNISVATVSVDGTTVTVTPVAVGTATITVTAGTDTYYLTTASTDCSVEFTAPVGGTTAKPSTPKTLFHESFGDNSGSARDWSDSYSVKTGETDVYSGITGYTVSNVKQGKNTTGYEASGLNQSTAATDAYIIIGPLDVANYNSLGLSYYWKAASIKGTYSTSAYYATSSGGAYTSLSGTGAGATDFVERSYSLPAAAQVSTLYLKIVWNTSNTQGIIDEVELEGALPGTESVTLNSSGYATFCSQYPLDFTSATGYTAWQITGIVGDDVTLSKVTGKVKGGTGLLLKGTASAIISIASADSDTELAGNKLVGTTAPTYITATNGDYTNFGLKGDKFVKAANGGVIGANKAYLPIETSKLSSARSLNMVFEDETTGISEMKTMKWNDNQSVYNLNGQKVENPTKGLYIVNGKKVVIK